MTVFAFWPFRRPVLPRVIVNTKKGDAFRGVLWRRGLFWGVVVLRNAEMMRRDGEPLKLDGEVVILRDNIDFLQAV